jgi:hypothetical protein
MRSIEALLELDDEAFVRAAYEALLDRAPDPEGLGNYVEQLRDGMPKVELLASLALSDEGVARSRGSAARGKAVLRARDRYRASVAPEVDSYEALVALHDEAFIRAAYLAVMGRAADEEGLAAYVPALRSGAPKARVLSYLRGSRESAERDAALAAATTPEAQRQRALLAQVDRAVRRDGWQRIPFAGRWIGALLGAERDDEVHAKLRRIENTLYRMTEAPGNGVAAGDAAHSRAGEPEPEEETEAANPGGERVLVRPAVSAAPLLSTLPSTLDR